MAHKQARGGCTWLEQPAGKGRHQPRDLSASGGDPGGPNCFQALGLRRSPDPDLVRGSIMYLRFSIRK